MVKWQLATGNWQLASTQKPPIDIQDIVHGYMLHNILYIRNRNAAEAKVRKGALLLMLVHNTLTHRHTYAKDVALAAYIAPSCLH